MKPRNRWLTAFATYNEGMRVPTAMELTCADPTAPCKLPNAFLADPPLKKVVSRTAEIGARGRIGKIGHWSAALFQTRLFDASAKSENYPAVVADFGRRPRRAAGCPGMLPAQSPQRSACFEPRRASVKLMRITAPFASSTSLPQLSQTSLVTRATDSSSNSALPGA